jgi:phage tail protein X
MASVYTTKQGDTWDIIAHKVYQDAKQMGLLLSANPLLIDTIIFSAGVEVNIPDLPAESPSDYLPPWRKS